MGRPEHPVNPTDGPLPAFAHDLRALREKAGGRSYRTLSRKAGYSASALSAAARGLELPTLAVTLAYVGACNGDPIEWTHRWQELSTKLASSAEPHPAAPAPNTAHSSDSPTPPAPSSVPTSATPPARNLSTSPTTSPPNPALSPTTPPTPPSLSTPAALARCRSLLNAVRRHWIDAELIPSLAVTGRFPSQLTEYRRGRDTHLPLPPTEPRRLLTEAGTLTIVGARGVGKTLLLLEIARALLDDWPADPDQPIPVVLPLSSWSPRAGDLETWVVEQLLQLYNVDRELGWAWVGQRRLLLLLDGLDEVPPEHRDSCVAAIEEYRHARGATFPLVLTCGTDVYTALTTAPRTRRVVEVRPLTVDQVARHLAAAGPELAGLRTALAADPGLAELVTTPLFLAVASVAYRGRTAAAVPTGVEVERWRAEVLADYVARRLHDGARPHPTRFSEPQTARVLSWLATTMTARNQTVFLPDRMQPDLLTRRWHRWLVSPGLALLVGLVTALCFGLSGGWALELISGDTDDPRTRGLVATVIGGLATGPLMGWQVLGTRIEPLAPPRQSAPAWRRTIRHAALCALAGTVVGLLLGSWFGELTAQQTLGVSSFLIVGISGSLLGSAAGGAVLGLTAGLAVGVLTGLEQQATIRPAQPGIGMRDTARTALLAGVLGVLLGGLAYGLLLGIPLGVVVALRLGGGAWLRHWTLRLLLWREGAIPLRFLDFLHHAHRTCLLNEIGGGYKFTHPLCQRHFTVRNVDQWPAIQP
ncbi:NACHT domain-containing protein [Crossiella sp. CA-258035]|uniref:NACHT domain-containing protein n=1 Tax=Crossiella sp. CA-258035 TaxID=2981138 RepID=UPI0024BD4591|nr:NACHT domain-containing protein [Crossiella sp. CA-258035]WHT16871.1 NACHT domain-containing protein [Crossiella sp. CA-258035]